LITGGQNQSGVVTNSVFAYNPTSGAWAQKAPMSQARALHTATLLDDGTVLVVGGVVFGRSILATAELYDFSLDTWSTAPAMSKTRSGHAATRLPTGEVTIAVGWKETNWALADTEIYVPPVK
jgi:hypothetical protein